MNVPRQWHNKDTPGNGGFAMFCSDFIVSPPTEDVNKKTHIYEVCLLGDALKKRKSECRLHSPSSLHFVLCTEQMRQLRIYMLKA